ncbi:MAG: YegP family protein, partial [Halobacteriales archaeon]|nr:YegP family protein [Halobacteriales archaeon]
ADGASTFATRDQATAAIEDLRAEAVRAPVRVLDRLAIVVAESDGTWYWEVVDTDREPIAEGSRTYADRNALNDELTSIQAEARNCIVFDIEDYVFRLHHQDGDEEQADGWTWELIDEDRNAITTSVRTYDTEREARDAIDRIRRIAPDAGSIDYDVAAFEVTETADGWRWRLIDEDDVTIAAGTEVHETEAAAIDELEGVKAVVADASILEIDTAAFELYENDDGWRWRLVDDDGDLVGRSIEAYAERSAAREEMRTVKELGPSARTAVAEYA